MSNLGAASTSNVPCCDLGAFCRSSTPWVPCCYCWLSNRGRSKDPQSNRRHLYMTTWLVLHVASGLLRTTAWHHRFVLWIAKKIRVTVDPANGTEIKKHHQHTKRPPQKTSNRGYTAWSPEAPVKFAAVLGIVVFSTFCPVMQVFLSVYHCLSTLHRESRKMQEEEEGKKKKEKEEEEDKNRQEQTGRRRSRRRRRKRRKMRNGACNTTTYNGASTKITENYAGPWSWWGSNSANT